MKRRRGRGRISGIELLPDEASDIIVWASNELAARSRTQTDIYAEFRDKLIALQGEQGLGFDIPSFSAFNRMSVQQALAGREMEQTRQVVSAIAGRFDRVGNEDLTIVAIEALKTLAWQIITIRMQGTGTATPKELLELSRALQSLVSTSKMSNAQRDAFNEELEAATDEVIDKASAAAKEAGVSAEAIAQMRRDFLGVRPKARDEQ